jgi:hypothetical protein
VEAGQSVEAGAQLVVLEAMKMEHSIRAPHAGVIKALYCQEGEMVSRRQRAGGARSSGLKLHRGLHHDADDAALVGEQAFG